VDFALRYSHYIGDIDIGVNVFSGTSREPRLVASPKGDSLLPIYDQIDQLGIDLQYTNDSWLWKLEAIARNGATHSFAAAVGGFEFTLYQLAESTATRLAFNDVQDTTLLAGASYDTETGEIFLNIEAERRFGEDWFGELRVRAFSGAKQGDDTYWLQKDDYMQLSISRYF
jgi:hypothetical protein